MHPGNWSNEFPLLVSADTRRKAVIPAVSTPAAAAPTPPSESRRTGRQRRLTSGSPVEITSVRTDITAFLPDKNNAPFFGIRHRVFPFLPDHFGISFPDFLHSHRVSSIPNFIKADGFNILFPPENQLCFPLPLHLERNGLNRRPHHDGHHRHNHDHHGKSETSLRQPFIFHDHHSE